MFNLPYAVSSNYDIDRFFSDIEAAHRHANKLRAEGYLCVRVEEFDRESGEYVTIRRTPPRMRPLHSSQDY